jgi:hypothetical protein
MTDGSATVTRFELVGADRAVGPFATPDPSVRYVFELTPALVTRTIRFATVASTGGNTGLRELELLAAPEAP